MTASKRQYRCGKCSFDGYYISIRPPAYQGTYDIPIERCKTAESCMDWIHQIAMKRWGREVMGDFLKVLFKVIPGGLWQWKG